MGHYRAREWIGRLLAVVICTTAAGAQAKHSQAAQQATDVDPAACGALDPNASIGVGDYRLRNSSESYVWRADDVKRNHLDPARQSMDQGDYSYHVMADIDYMLQRWPNHLPGLELLIRYNLHGAPGYGFPPVYCYFLHARQLAPDDPGVLLHEGYWFWRKGDRQRAIEAYKDAVALDPTSADAHYSLGLIYLETRDYDKAVEQARAAYAEGYPLPGLRRKLAEAGRWPPPPVVQQPGTAVAPATAPPAASRRGAGAAPAVPGAVQPTAASGSPQQPINSK